MSASNRATLLNKTAKILKKHYKPSAPPSNRTLLEHLLYACCLESSTHETTDDVFAKLQESYFDWNEVRVTTVAELSEVMSQLADPPQAARRLKRSLQSVFEKFYSFDIDALKKQNLGKAIQDLAALDGITSFAVDYLTQNALGGHAIPMNAGAYSVFVVVCIITEDEAKKKKVTGLERAIPKNKGVEFASLLHQLGVEYMSNAFGTRVRSILLEIAPDAKDRLPKREAKPEESKPSAAGEPAKGRKKSAEPEMAADGPKKKLRAKATEEPSAVSAPKETKKSATKRLARKKPR